MVAADKSTELWQHLKTYAKLINYLDQKALVKCGVSLHLNNSQNRIDTDGTWSSLEDGEEGLFQTTLDMSFKNCIVHCFNNS